MDLVPKPLNSIIAPLDVPVAEITPYELETWENFPSQLGFTQNNGLPDIQERSISDVASLLQSWLYFGLLAEFLGHPINHVDFVTQKTYRDGSTIELVSMALLEEWIQPSKLKLRERHDKLRSIFAIAGEQSRVLDTMMPSETPLPEIMLSIKILIDMLTSFVFPVDGHPNKSLRPMEITSMHKPSPATELLISRLIAAHWCPSQAWQICLQHKHVVCYFLSLLTRRYRSGLTHERCQRSQCVANDVNGQSYQTRHECPPCNHSLDHGEVGTRTSPADRYGDMLVPICQRCTCTLPQDKIHIHMESIRKIVREGGIPLVSIQRDAGANIILKVQAAAATSRYVAISHVWSDGLGNRDSNSLPPCVLEQLTVQLDRLPLSPREHPSHWLTGLKAMSLYMARRTGFRMNDTAPKLFWMDTLCIPVGEEYNDLRLRAINSMALIYASASQVLVLDSELQEVCIEKASLSEIYGHILCSSWQTRCWTLQEGTLARSKRFQLNDGTVDLETPKLSGRDLFYGKITFRTIMCRVIPSFSRGGAKYLRKKVRSFRKDKYALRQQESLEEVVRKMIETDLRRGEQESLAKFWSWPARNLAGLATSEALYQQFICVWNSLGYRFTTQREDILLILASLLDLNSHALNELNSYEEKIKTLLWNVGSKLPLSLLYNTGPRINEEKDSPNRWVPQEPSASPLMQKPSMKLSERSLSVSGKDTAETGSILLVVQSRLDHRLQNIQVCDSHAQKMHEVFFHRMSEDALETEEYASFCILVEGHSYTDDTANALETRGACFLITRSSTHTGDSPESRVQHIRARYDCPLRIRSHDLSGETTSAPAETTLALESEDGGSFNAETISTPWELKVEADFADLGPRLPRRPIQPYGAPNATYLSQLAFYVLFVVCYHLLPGAYLLAELCFTWAKLNWYLRARDLTWFIFYLPPLLSYVDYLHMPVVLWLAKGPLLSEIAIIRGIVNVFRTRGIAFDVVIPVFIIWQICLNLMIIILVCLLYPLLAVFYLLVVPRAHDAWAATFNKGWDPSKSHAWFWTLSRFLYRTSRIWSATENRLKRSVTAIGKVFALPTRLGTRLLARRSTLAEARQHGRMERNQGELNMAGQIEGNNTSFAVLEMQ